MSRFRKLSHAMWYCQYHMVWVPAPGAPGIRYLAGDCRREVKPAGLWATAGEPRQERLSDGSFLSRIYRLEKDRRHNRNGVMVRVAVAATGEASKER